MSSFGRGISNLPGTSLFSHLSAKTKKRHTEFFHGPFQETEMLLQWPAVCDYRQQDVAPEDSFRQIIPLVLLRPLRHGAFPSALSRPQIIQLINSKPKLSNWGKKEKKNAIIQSSVSTTDAWLPFLKRPLFDQRFASNSISFKIPAPLCFRAF